MGWKLFQSSAALPGFGFEKTMVSRHIVGFFGRSRKLCRILKLCKTFGTAMLQNISRGTLSEL